MTFDRLFINTGAEANLPKIDALVEGGRIFTSKTLLAQKQQIKNNKNNLDYINKTQKSFSVFCQNYKRKGI